MKNDTASMDRWTKLYTWLFVFFYFGMVYFMINSKTPINAVVIVSGILWAAFLVSYLMVPKIFTEQNEIVIKNLFTTIHIPVDSIRSIEAYPRIGLNVRTMGVGGIFGFFGYFNWGEVWYVTNIYKKVKMVTNGGKIYVISPENPEAFVDQMMKRKEVQ